MRWAFVTVPFIILLGFASARLAPTGTANRWYMALVKPAGTPPDWAFPVAWTIIYVMLGLALAMILHARGSRLRGPAITLFFVQLAVNLIWSPLFFGMHALFWSLVTIVAMFVLALATTMLFGRIRTGAAWLLVPYLAWLCYAGALTYGINALNPGGETLVPSSSTTQIMIH